MERKKKLRIIQLSLLVMGTIIIFFTYLTQEERISESLIPKETQEKIKNQTSSGNENSDVFYNIEYSGLDLAGNRYILKSKEAFNNKDQQEVVNMKFVEAIFYFKDETNLNVTSNSGVYNNRTLDMNFYGNVKAKYEGSELFAEKAEYSNSKGYLVISEKVKVKDLKGTMVADELLFDIKNQTLDIASFNDSKINANVNLK
tara:strand:- start:44 stop:646 length:603 start_codon:yes stop_codon:yes gene_type:complete